KDIVVSPAITGLSLTQGKPGDLIIISGKNFSGSAAANQVSFNGVTAEVRHATAEELQVYVPLGAFTGKIKVVTPDGAVTSVSDFTVFQPPTVASFSPAEGVVGSEVILQGNNLTAD